MPKQAGNLTPAEIWWGLLRARIRDNPSALSELVGGTIQFEVHGDERKRYFHLELNGTHTRAAHGMALWPSAWVESSDDELWQLINDAEIPSGALRVSGDHEIVRSLFAAMGKSRPMSAVDLRAGGLS